MKKAFSLLFFFSLSLLLPNQVMAGQLSGKILGNDDNPMIGAQILFKNSTTGKTITTTSSDFNGGYGVDVPDGTYDITISSDTPKGKVEKIFKNEAVTTTRQKNFTLATETNAPIPQEHTGLSYPLIGGITIGALFVLVLFVMIKKRK